MASSNRLRHGPATRNPDGHADFRTRLEGRVTRIETVNRSYGLKRSRMSEAIDW